MIDGIGRCGTPRLALPGSDTVSKANDLRSGMALTTARPQAISQISGIARDLAASPPSIRRGSMRCVPPSPAAPTSPIPIALPQR